MKRYTTHRSVISITLLLLACLALSSCAAFGAPPAQAQTQQPIATQTPPEASATPVAATTTDTAQTRTISVTGQAEASAEPNIARLQVGVRTQATTATLALEQNNQQTHAVLDQLRVQGVAQNDLQTSGFSVSPTYNMQGNEVNEVTGYMVANTVSVTLRQIDKLGAVLEAVVQTGANEIYGIGFDVSNREALEQQARASALANARTKAEQLAQAAGVTLGEIVQISDTTTSAPIPLGAAGQRAGDVPIAPGSQSVSASVSVTYALR